MLGMCCFFSKQGNGCRTLQLYAREEGVPEAIWSVGAFSTGTMLHAIFFGILPFKEHLIEECAGRIDRPFDADALAGCNFNSMRSHPQEKERLNVHCHVLRSKNLG